MRGPACHCARNASLRAAGLKRSPSTPRPTTVRWWKPAAPRSRRAVADDDEAQVGPVAPRPLEGAQRELDVLLGGDPAHREQHRRLGPGLPLRAQRGAARRRREARGVDAAADDGQLVEAGRGELPPGRVRRHEGAVGQVVEAPHQAERRPGEQAEAVVARVLVEIGAEIRGRGDAEGACGQERRPGQRAGRRQVHQVGLALAKAPLQRARAGQAEAQVGIHRDHAAGGAQLIASIEAPFTRLARPDQLHEVAARAQEPYRPLDREGYPVQLRRPGFGDVGDAHSSAG